MSYRLKLICTQHKYNFILGPLHFWRGTHTFWPIFGTILQTLRKLDFLCANFSKYCWPEMKQITSHFRVIKLNKTKTPFVFTLYQNHTSALTINKTFRKRKEKRSCLNYNRILLRFCPNCYIGLENFWRSITSLLPPPQFCTHIITQYLSPRNNYELNICLTVVILRQ